MVVTLMCSCGHASHAMRGRKTLQMRFKNGYAITTPSLRLKFIRNKQFFHRLVLQLTYYFYQPPH